MNIVFATIVVVLSLASVQAQRGGVCSWNGAGQVCQNLHSNSANQINAQIKAELHASYTYLSMAFHFKRHDVALHGISKFFMDSSTEENTHAHKLMDYLTKRGGNVELHQIPKPEKERWTTALEAFEDALMLERKVNHKLLALHQVAQDENDPHLQDFLEGEYLTEQVESIKELGDYVSKLKRMETDHTTMSLGTHIFDKEVKST